MNMQRVGKGQTEEKEKSDVEAMEIVCSARGCAQFRVNETRHNGVKHNYQREKEDVRGSIIHSPVSLLLGVFFLPSFTLSLSLFSPCIVSFSYLFLFTSRLFFRFNSLYISSNRI